MEHTILVVEDETGIRKAICIYMKNQGYRVFDAANGKEGLELIEKEDIHLAIVDIMMPVMDGVTMVMKARETHDFPILFLSAKSEEVDKIHGLNIGADDYITKPFASTELIARVRAQLRRYEQILALKKGQESKDSCYVVGDLELEPLTKEVRVGGKLVHLTTKEFKILELLMKNPGRVYSAQQIYGLIWEEEAINTETIMVHIRKLREKIEADPKRPLYIKVVWGIGYKIERMDS